MRVSVIIPNRNDSVMLAITIRTILENLRGINGEIIVADNSDQDIYNIISKRFDKTGRAVSPLPLAYTVKPPKTLKVIHINKPSMYRARQDAADMLAQGEYLMNSDSHVVWGQNIIRRCITFMNNHPNAGVCSGPIGWVQRPDSYAKTHCQENKNGGIFGPWGKKKIPAKIPWAFGFRIVRKSWFDRIRGYSFFADHNVSWGGGEFYLCVKSWLLGGENWCINCNPVYHIGPYSKEVESLGYHYRLYGNSGSGQNGIGILAAFYALGGDEAKAECMKSAEGIKSQYDIDIDRDWSKARKYAEEDHEWILKNQVISFKELLEKKPWNDEKP